MTILVWRTEANLAAGRIDVAIDDVALALRLSRDLRPRSAMMGQLYSVAIDNQALDVCIKAILKGPGTTIGHCDRILAVLSQHAEQAIDPMTEGLRYEYPAMLDSLHRQEMHEDVATLLGWKGMTLGQVLANTYKITDDDGERDYEQLSREIDVEIAAMTPGDYQAEVAAIKRHFAHLLEHSRDAGPDIDRTIAEAEALIGNNVARHSVRGFGKCAEAFRRDRTRLAGTQCLVALFRWNLQNPGQLPPDLSAVCRAAGLGAVPIDGYSGQPLLWTVIEGQFVIYSVAGDRLDSGGTVDWELGQQSGDWIFRWS